MFGARRKATVEAAGQVALANTSPAGQRFAGWGVGISRLAPGGYDFVPPADIWSRESAMSIPTISRARDLLCSAVGALPLTLWTVDFGRPEPVEARLPPAAWMDRPDPNRTRQFVLSWTVDDLLFGGRAYWRISDRYVTGYPSTFEWLPAADVNVGSDGRVTCRGQQIDGNDLVEFLSPLDGLLYTGWRAIQTALNLDNAAERFSTVELPAGWLEQTENSEPLDEVELAEIATKFQAARNTRTVAALNPYVRWRESEIDPSKLQLTEARAYQSLELSRLANIPPYLTGAPAGTAMTYTNTAQAKADLIDFGALPFVGCIEQTLSAGNVTPAGQWVRLETNAWLRSPFTPNENASRNDAEIAFNPNEPLPGRGGPGRPRDFDRQTGAL